MQVKPSTRTFLPTVHPQEIIELLMNELSPTDVSAMMLQLANLTPLPILHLGPIDTLGPILQSGPTELL